MAEDETQYYTAFAGHRILHQGPLDEVVLKMKKKLREDKQTSLLVFSDLTGKQMDFDLSGTDEDVLDRLQVYLPDETSVRPRSHGPGRPKLGVMWREVSLLPRHWEWLSSQSGGASATLRRLVDEARKSTSAREQIKQAQERTYKFLSALAGDFQGYEEALRALYARDRKKFEAQMSSWPRDVRAHAYHLSLPVFEKN